MLAGCKIGQAKITGGYNLKANYIVHTVGPVWQGGSAGEEDLLAGCYRKSLQLAVDKGCQSIAFPGISTGRFRYPLDLACSIAVSECGQFLAQHSALASVVFCTFDDNATKQMQLALDAAL